MHLLYALDFDVTTTSENEAAPYETLLDHVAEWLSFNNENSIVGAELEQAGALMLAPVRRGGPGNIDREARWEVIHGPESKGMRAFVGQQVDSGLELQTRITVTSTPSGVRLRIGVSRDMPGGSLAPVRETDVYQPGLVRSVANDESLELRAAGQTIDSRYLQVRTQAEASALSEALVNARRLPVLIVHVRTPTSWEVARTAATKLIGLVRVVTVNSATRVSLGEHATAPFGGAALVWSDNEAPVLPFTARQVSTLQGEGVRRELMARVAPLAALARGIDDRWRAVQSEARRAEAVGLNRAVLTAREQANAGAELDALRTSVDALREQLEDAEALADDYAHEASQLRVRAEAADSARAQESYWRDQYFSVVSNAGAPSEEVDPWTAIPDMISGHTPEETFLALADASGQRIAFTDEAARSWKKIAYPDPEDMTAKLTALARAAQELYGGDPGTIGRIDDWFKVRHGLNVATSDDTIEKSKNLRSFVHEGSSHSQVPHVKVRDAVKPNEVGRIHFAFDTEGERLLVNHVALKLY